MDHKFGIAVHGGAGKIAQSSTRDTRDGIHCNALKAALNQGYKLLEKGGSALDAVETAIKSLEDYPHFNAGRGSVFNSEGRHEMDASIMWGKDLKAGAVGLIRNVKNPVALARAMMEKSPHVFLCGQGAEDFARQMGLEIMDDSYFYDEYRYCQWLKAREEEGACPDHNIDVEEDKKLGTVGAVALDKEGNLAAGTSTGGMTNKRFGRIGDSPVIGAGTYANNLTCAVSCTGHGELFIRAVAAYDISALMEYKGYSLKDACHEVIMHKLVKLEGIGGAIAIDKYGNIALPFNTDRMYRALKSSDGRELVALYQEGMTNC